ncbi:carbon storage regulator, CsrA [Desulforamulus reducens MI-1]|uniref:Translational regulator CsrA n=1 Tax=Desulforamulus reducens (strain ATCC BAA-1160 / DSM 100696 / MI-1) TaxID=349161 RepID=CSRA_DESRM|nr:carbon storage regulator CsrA [Desulforamulus reducens]A4J774.1 RecName: Full=Translational regulator CsrA [Desulforamulus reducens MI-1]ABO50927.1 carbon storage regulator, CsrA [Desulforamulus reducens MI-1]
MLILSRKKNESIHIGDNIIITVVDIGGDNIKIGIDAPKNVQIFRSELLKAVEQENKNAVSSKSVIQDLAQLIKGDEKKQT